MTQRASEFLEHLQCTEFLEHIQCAEFLEHIQCAEFLEHIQCAEFLEHIQCAEFLEHTVCGVPGKLMFNIQRLRLTSWHIAPKQRFILYAILCILYLYTIID